MAETRIAIVGSGTIGLSFAALHLNCNPNAYVAIYDNRSDLQDYINQHLPKYLAPCSNNAQSRLRVAETLEDAVHDAHVVQEQGPENVAFKSQIWPQIETHAPQDALFWSSTSGIRASVQSRDMKDKSRLLVVHPYNPPHVMPLLEIVPSPSTAQLAVDRTVEYWRAAGRSPVVIKQECTGFVANRLAFALFREAIHLVNEGVVSVDELDQIVQSSMGPRWSVAGPFKSYHAGGGSKGLEGFFANIGNTVQECWDDLGRVTVGSAWERTIFDQTMEKYGQVNTTERDVITKRVLQVIQEEKNGNP